MESTKKLIRELECGALDDKLTELYADQQQLSRQRLRYCRALQEYERIFGEEDVEIYSAPGRSEVCGNHTDHQRGQVLAASVNLDAIAVVHKTEDRKIRLLSEGYSMLEIDLNDLKVRESEEGTSSGLIRGMAHGLQEKGYEIGGFHAYVTSDVLGGAGLSSSAAFEILIGTILSGLYNGCGISPAELAVMAQYAENVYFGKPCGLMDQMACSVGGLIHIDFQDAEHPVVEKVEVDFSAYGHSLCITDTKGSHADLTHEYAAVPREMKMAAAYFEKEYLREVDPDLFYKNIAGLREKMGDRPVLRALHFFEEEKRVEGQVKALREGKFQTFLALVLESGRSSFQYLQNVYSSQDVQHQAVSVGLAVSDGILKGQGACRVHGGGFAGTIQAFVKDEFVEEYKSALDGVFGAGSCHVLKVRPCGGTLVR